jgi:hypothetical protein
MPYLGSEPGAITDAFTDTFTGDGSETAFTLSGASTTNAVFVRIHGVVQRNGTDFNVEGTTLTFTTAPPNASNNIVVQFFAPGSILDAPSDNSITLAKLAHGTDGNLISYDTSGAPVAIATGNDGQVLTSAGAGAAPAFESLPAGAAPSWTFVSSVTISDGDAAVAFTNMEDGYDYKYRITGLIPVTDNADPSAFLGVAGPTYRTAGYRVTSHYRGASGTGSTVGTDTATIMLDSGMGTGSVSDEQLFVILELYNPANSGQTNIKYEGTGENSNAEHIWTSGWGWYDTDESHTSLQIKSSSGNLEAGIIYQYRRPIVFS